MYEDFWADCAVSLAGTLPEDRVMSAGFLSVGAWRAVSVGR